MDRRFYYPLILMLLLGTIPYASAPHNQNSSAKYSLNPADISSTNTVNSNQLDATVNSEFSPRYGITYRVTLPRDREKQAGAIFNQLMKSHLKVESILGRIEGLSVNLSLVSQTEFFQGVGAPKWANAMYKSGEIFIPLSKTTTIESAVFLHTLTHEYTHAVLARLSNGNCPAWIEEGLAQILEGGMDSAVSDAFFSWFRKNKLLAFSELAEGFTNFNLELASVAYGQSAVTVGALIDDHGTNKLREFIRLTALGRSQEDAFFGAYGLSIADFEEDLNVKLYSRLI